MPHRQSTSSLLRAAAVRWQEKTMACMIKDNLTHACGIIDLCHCSSRLSAPCATRKIYSPKACVIKFHAEKEVNIKRIKADNIIIKRRKL